MAVPRRVVGLVAVALALSMVAGGCSGPEGVAGADPEPGQPSPTPSAPAAPTASPGPSARLSSDPSTRPSPGPPTRPSPGPSTRPSSAPRPTACERLTATLTLREQVGQLFMVGISSGGLSSADARVIERRQIGSVILLGNSTAGRSPIRRLTEAVRSVSGGPKDVDVMLTVDQEGGQVQRLRGPGFSSIPSARAQAELSDRELVSRAASWARELQRAGIDADLAPVADVVPRRMESVNRPIGLLRRGYGPEPEVVAAKVASFVRGMDGAGIATAVKHFPGLGQVRGNTDFERRVVDRSTTRRDEDLLAFRAGVAAGVDMVMVSSAFYSRIDQDRPAAFSPVVIGQLIRADLGFGGVVISDDLAAQAFSDVRPAQRVLRFLRAGGDLAIVGDGELVDDMVSAIVTAAEDDPTVRNLVGRSAARVVAMKERRGLADCG